MPYWNKLDVQRAIRSYHIPSEVANDEANSFWGKLWQLEAVSRLYDGPFDFFAFVNQAANHNLLKLHIASFDKADTAPWEFDEDFDIEEIKTYKYNPLLSSGGSHLSFDKADELQEFTKILRHETENIDENSNLEPFRKINEDELPFVAFMDEREYYAQSTMCIQNGAKEEFLTILTIPSAEAIKKKIVFFSLATINKKLIADTKMAYYDFHEQAISFLFLDKLRAKQLSQFLLDLINN